MKEDRMALSKREFASRIGVSVDSVNREIAKGNLRILHFGRRVLIPVSELERLLKSQS